MKNFMEARRRSAEGQGGFTLIELLVVIIILGILAAVVVFAVGGVGDKGQTSACRIDTRTLRTAAEAYFANDQAPPADYGNGSNPPDGSTAAAGANAGPTVDETTYVTAGFLSEISDYHDVRVYDSNATAAVTPAVAILVADADCGTIGGVVGTGNNE